MTMTTSLIDELMKDVYAKKREALREGRPREVTEIIVHPEWLKRLMSEHNFAVNAQLQESGKITFMGVPVDSNPEVEKWEIIL